MYCSKCGNANPSFEKYCTKCNMSLDGSGKINPRVKNDKKQFVSELNTSTISPSMETNLPHGWFFKNNIKKTVGPVTRFELEMILNNGEISESTMVWPGVGSWRPISDYLEFQKIECKYCFSLIPAISKKCKNCGEWLDQYRMEGIVKACDNSFGHLVDDVDDEKNVIRQKTMKKNQKKDYISAIILMVGIFSYIIAFILFVNNHMIISNYQNDISNPALMERFYEHDYPHPWAPIVIFFCVGLVCNIIWFYRRELKN